MRPNVKNTPQYLDVDTDPRYLPTQAMRKAYNVRTYVNDDGGDFVLRNLFGSVIAQPQPTFAQALGGATSFVWADMGTGIKGIGYIRNLEKREVFVFVSGSLRDAIFRYGEDGNIIPIVLFTKAVLNFTNAMWIEGFATIGSDGQTMLYFTDNANEPKVIDVEQFRRATMEGITGQTTPFERVGLQKRTPPNTRPTFEFASDSNIAYNNLFNTAWQFRYRYVLETGEATEYSDVSDVAVSPINTYINVVNTSFVSRLFNVLNINVTDGYSNTRFIEIIGRDGKLNNWRQITRIDSNKDRSARTFTFRNDDIYPVVSQSEANKLYDAVPLQAATQAIVDNKSFFANYVEGFDNVPEIINDEGQNITLSPSYGLSNTFEETTGVNSISSTTFFTNFGVIEAFLGKSILINGEYRTLSGNFSISFPFTFSTNNINEILTPLQLYVQSVLGDTSYVVLVYISGGDLIVEVRANILVNVPFNTTSLVLNEFTAQNVPSFKSGAKHPFGIVYEDDFGRVSTVQPIKIAPYVKFYTERIAGEGQGASSIHYRLNTTPPTWAKYWRWVYGGNTSVDAFLQYSTLKVYKATGTDANANNTLYVSFRSFRGNEDSYKEQFNATIDYNFAEGDRLRIIKQSNANGTAWETPNEYLDFKVLGYEFLDDKSPIYDGTDATSIIQTTGWFLKVLSPNNVGWRWEDIETPANKWTNQSGTQDIRGAIFELYQPKANTENLLYNEIGDRYLIQNGNHNGQIRNQGEAVTQQVRAITTAVFTDIQGNKFVIGDEIFLNGQTRTIVDMFTKGTEYGLLLNPVLPLATGTYNATLLTTAAAGILTQGDVYYKPRLIRRNNNVTTRNYEIEYVEDYNFSDFFRSDTPSWGRTNIFSINAKRKRLPSSVIHSEPILKEDGVNGLSAFNIANIIFRDYNPHYGAINAVRDNGDNLVCFQEAKVFNLPIAKSVLQSADGGETLVLNNSVLPEAQYYGLENGINKNPETLARNGGAFYFFDVLNGDVCRLSTDGLTRISDYFMRTFFNKVSKLYKNSAFRFPAGFDKEYNEYQICIPNTVNSVVLTFTEGIDVYNTPYSLQNISLAGGVYTISGFSLQQSLTPPVINWEDETRNWEDVCENWDYWGRPVVFMNDFVNTNTVTLAWGSTSIPVQNITLIFTIGTQRFYVQAELNIIANTITFDAAQSCGGYTISSTTSTEQTGQLPLIVFNEKSNKWIGSRNVVSDVFAPIGNEYLYFAYEAANRGFRKMNVDAINLNRLNGVNTEVSSIAIVVNQAPSEVKVADAISIEGNNAPQITFTDTLGGATTLNTSAWQKKEGLLYSPIPFVRNTQASVNAGSIFLGSFVSLSGGVIQTFVFSAPLKRMRTNFANTRVRRKNNINENILGNVLSVDVATNSIVISAVLNPPQLGDVFFLEQITPTSGSKLRGNYFEYDITFQAAPLEVFAINTIIQQSKLYNA